MEADASSPWPESPCATSVPHTGVVFVHGLGFQEAGQTFADSLSAFVRVLRDATTPPAPTADPVIRARGVDGGGFPVAELEVATSAGRQHWVLTEAWWTKSFNEPSVATMFRWLGPGTATARAASRLRWRDSATGCRPPSLTERFNVFAEEILLSVLITSGLLGYALLKLVLAIIPLASLREATIGPFERFITGWAGDMRTMIADEAQAAMIRRRVADACRETLRLGATNVVVVAHSGGAVASYMTLTDPEYSDIQVERFITYGSGLNVAWRLLGLSQESDPEAAMRTGGLLAIALPPPIKHWLDFWASDDPVPAGPVNDPPPAVSGPRRMCGTPCAGTRVYNRLSVIEDHGTYLDNDEEFVVPVVNAIHRVARAAGDPKLVPTGELLEVVTRRRERVTALAMWRQFTNALAAMAVLGSIATGVVLYWSEARLGQPLEDVAAGVLSLIPEMEGLGGPVEWLRAMDLWPLALSGYLLLPAILVLVTWKAAPWVTGMRSLWHRGFAPSVAEFAVSLLTVLLAAAAIIAIPGLLALGLASSPFWELDVSQQLASRLGAGGQGSTPWFIDWLIHVVLLVILIGVVLLGRGTLTVVSSVLKESDIGRLLGSLFTLAGGVFALVAIVYALVQSPAFGAFVVGWLLVWALAIVAQRLGRWRWAAWDRQERRVARTRLAGQEIARPYGRWADALIFCLMGLAFGLIFIAIAIRPWFDLLISWITLGGVLMILIGVAIGIAFDAVNERDDVPQRAASMNLVPQRSEGAQTTDTP